jgi:hypothetical protein
VRQGQGARLCGTNCDDTAFRPPCARARTGAGHECLARLVQQGRRNFFAVPTALASGDSTSTASAVVTTSSPRRALGGCARHRAGNGRRTKAVKLHKVMRATMAPSVMKLAPSTVGTAMPSALGRNELATMVLPSVRASLQPASCALERRGAVSLKGSGADEFQAKAPAQSRSGQ